MADWLDAALDYIPSWLEMQFRIFKQPGCVMAIAYRGKIASRSMIEQNFAVCQNVQT
jgi:hypothetical protein